MSDDRFTIRGITVHKLATSYRHPRKKLTHTQKAPVRRILPPRTVNMGMLRK